MRKSKYTEEQIIGFLRQVEAGMSVKELGRKHGFSDARFYKWRAKYGGMNVSEAKRLKELESENGKLKKLLAEAHLDIHALKSVFGRIYVQRGASPTGETRSGCDDGNGAAVVGTPRLHTGGALPRQLSKPGAAE